MNKKIRIAFCVGSIKNKGGMEKVLANKANFFVEHLGYDVHIITQNQQNQKLPYHFDKRIKFHDINLNNLSKKNIKWITFIRNIFRLRVIYEGLFNKIKPEIIIVSERGYLDFVVPTIYKNTPKIREFHFSKSAVKVHASLMTIKNKLKHLLMYKFIFYFFNKYDYLVLLTDEDKLNGNYKTNTIVIPNMIDNVNHSLRSRLISKNAISVGSMHDKRKNFEEQIYIWKEIVKKNPNWKLFIYGDGKEKKNIEQLIIKHSLEDKVILKGNVDNINDAYLNSSFFIFTSRAEGLPMVLIEAQSFGLPIVSYDCPTGPNDIIENNETGFVIHNKNRDEFIKKIITLIENESLRFKMGEMAKLNSLNYGQEIIGKKWNIFLNKVLNEKQNNK